VAKGTTAQRNGSPTAGDVRYNTTLNGTEYWNGTAWIVLGQAPTVQRFTSGTAQTYTPSTGGVRIRVRMVGGGGGGGGATANVGSAGGDTSFGSWTAIKGSGGPTNNGGGNAAGGAGGVDGSGTLIVRFSGGTGGPSRGSAGTVNAGGGDGAAS